MSAQLKEDDYEINYEDGSIDAGLILLMAATPPGVVRTVEEIAFVCGCSRARIWQLEKRAKDKLKRKFLQHGLRGVPR